MANMFLTKPKYRYMQVDIPGPPPHITSIARATPRHSPFLPGSQRNLERRTLRAEASSIGPSPKNAGPVWTPPSNLPATEMSIYSSRVRHLKKLIKERHGIFGGIRVPDKIVNGVLVYEIIDEIPELTLSRAATKLYYKFKDDLHDPSFTDSLLALNETIEENAREIINSTRFIRQASSAFYKIDMNRAREDEAKRNADMKAEREAEIHRAQQRAARAAREELERQAREAQEAQERKEYNAFLRQRHLKQGVVANIKSRRTNRSGGRRKNKTRKHKK
jgi:hypothetical protein